MALRGSATPAAASVDQATSAGEEFAKIFYETMDKRRHVLAHLYTDSSTVVWNGNACKGLEPVINFLQSLPSSTHTLTSLDCQPVPDAASPGQTSILVVIEGWVKYDGHENETFSQNFLLAEQSGVWKIVSDCFRFIDA